MTLRHRFVALGATAALACTSLTAQAADGMMDDSSTFGFNGISGLIGIVLPEGDLDTTFGLEAHANLGAPFASAPQLVFLPGLSFWTGGYDTRAGGEDFSIDYSEFGILADAVYLIPVGEAENGLMLYAGGGLGMYFTSFDVPTVDFVNGQFVERKSSESETDIGFSLLGGITKPVGESLDIIGQMRLKFDGIDTVNFQGGIQYRFAK